MKGGALSFDECLTYVVIFIKLTGRFGFMVRRTKYKYSLRVTFFAPFTFRIFVINW